MTIKAPSPLFSSSFEKVFSIRRHPSLPFFFSPHSSAAMKERNVLTFIFPTGQLRGVREPPETYRRRAVPFSSFPLAEFSGKSLREKGRTVPLFFLPRLSRLIKKASSFLLPSSGTRKLFSIWVLGKHSYLDRPSLFFFREQGEVLTPVTQGHSLPSPFFPGSPVILQSARFVVSDKRLVFFSFSLHHEKNRKCKPIRIEFVPILFTLLLEGCAGPKYHRKNFSLSPLPPSTLEDCSSGRSG